MRVIAIVQARLGSTRLPNKVIKEIAGKPMIEILLTRLSQSKEINQIVVATSTKRENDNLQILVESLGYECTRGSENDVLNRFYSSAKKLVQMWFYVLLEIVLWLTQRWLIRV
jgi:spore coat polysaccharide biosynthesis protein SpsF (cytidylyltransferase family)